jgi:GNAT superfamily N-acetyltransferase
MSALTIRQATRADKAALFNFLRLAYPDRWQYKFPERWEWEFERNPFLRGDRLPIWIAVDGSLIVGQSCALVEPLVIHGQEHRVGWGVDFFVLPEYRGQGLGTRLQQANDAGNEIFMSLSMAASAAHIKSNIGLQTLPPVPVFTKIVRHEPESVLRTLAERTKLPENVLRRAGVHRLGARWLTARDAWKDHVPRRDRGLFTTPAGMDLIPVQRFGPEVDELWARLSGKFSGLVRRDSEYLNWKFTQQPHVEHQRTVIWRGGQASGYVVFRRAFPSERNAGLILDVFANPNDDETIRALLKYAGRELSAQGVAYIMAASSVPAFQCVYLEMGFKQTKEAVPMVRAGMSMPREGWLFGKGDHDWDQFPLA